VQAAVLEGRGHNAYGCLVLVDILHKAVVTAGAVCGVVVVVAWTMIDEVILPWSLVKRGTRMEQGIVLCMVVGPGGKKIFIFTSLSRGDEEMIAECRVVAKW